MHSSFTCITNDILFVNNSKVLPKLSISHRCVHMSNWNSGKLFYAKTLNSNETKMSSYDSQAYSGYDYSEPR